VANFKVPPKSDKEAVRLCMCRCHDGGEQDHTRRARAWSHTFYYLQGLREVASRYGTRHLPAKSFRDKMGRLRIRVEKALQMYQTEVGRLLTIDLNPVVDRKPGLALDAVRKESTAQAFLEDAVRLPFDLGLPGTRAAHLCAYGNVGYGVFAGQDKDAPWRPRLQIIPIWELRPIPAMVASRSDLVGLEWFKWVPYEDLRKSVKAFHYPDSKNESRLKLQDVAIGGRVETDQSPVRDPVENPGQNTGFDPSLEEVRSPTSKRASDTIKFVQLRQFYIHDDNGRLIRYIVLLGDHLAYDEDYTDEETLRDFGGIQPLMPIHLEDYLQTGTLFSRGFVDRLIPLNRQMEFLIADAIDNMVKADRQRKTWIPAAAGNNRREMQNIDSKSPFAYFHVDALAPTAYPRTIDPSNVGDTQGRLVNMLATIMDNLGAQGPLFSGNMPGRADAGPAVNAALEANRIPMASAGEASTRCWVGIYRAILSYIKIHFLRTVQKGTMPKNVNIRLGRLDQRIIGVKIDKDTGSIQLDPDLIPDPLTIDITIRAARPRDPETVLMELKEQLQGGLIPETIYWIKIVQEGLDVPVPSMTPYNNYEKAWLENLILFGDGQEPGTIEHIDAAEDHQIHLMVHNELVSSQVFFAASDIVQRKVMNHMQMYHGVRQSNTTDRAVALDQFGLLQNMSPEMLQAAGQQLMGAPQEAY
jgi:hypothetical protein